MRKAIILVFTALAFGALASSAFAEEDKNSPSLLVGSGEKVTGIKGEINQSAGSIQIIELLGARTVSAKEAKLLFENCDEITGHVEDTNLCNLVPIHLSTVTQEAASCRSENNKSEKDPVGVVLGLLDLHLAAEESLEGMAEMKLQPLLLAWILGTADEEELKFNCGLVKVTVKGVLACLMLPGLTESLAVEVLCKVTAGHDPELGHCELLCEPFGAAHKIGVEAALNGKEFKDAWVLLSAKGNLNKEFFIDD